MELQKYMEIGIVGLPYSGKSTLFSTLLNLKSETSPQGKSNSERGMIKVPDDRLAKLTAIFNPKKEVKATVEFIKVPGLEGDGGKTHGLPAQFLANLKNVDAILVMIRDFENDFYPHPLDRVDARKDIEFINSELILSDLAIVETRVEKLEKQVLKIKDDVLKRELEVMKKLLLQLEEEKPIRELEFSENELATLKNYQFLTAKAILFVINIAEENIGSELTIEEKFSSYKGKNCNITSLSAEIEKEISELSEEDAAVFIDDLGIKEPALQKLIRSAYELLGLISFFTVGEDECRAWTIRRNSTAPKAAAAIHKDFERGFIRAEVIPYEDFIKHGTEAKCREAGALRTEGKEYIVKDGDVMHFLFNV
jgi:GTP-binding protein YchF